VVTGFRLALGGAQEAFGVTPDLACLGKSMANGMALSALVGKRDVMQAIARVGHGITFRGETLALAACRKTLEILERDSVCDGLERTGTTVREAFRAACRRHGVDADLSGPAARMTFVFGPSGRITPLGMQTLFIQTCLEHGVMTNGLLFPSAAHDEAAIERTTAAFERAAARLAAAARRGTLQGLLHMPAFHMFQPDDVLECPA